MLQLKPNCELCDKDLPADTGEAMICSYECTFCRNCVETILSNVCPNCGGGLCERPVRPAREYRKGVSLKQHPASQSRVNTKYTIEEIKTFSIGIKETLPKVR